MKLTVKSHFGIRVQPTDTQLLIQNGKVLKDESTLAENNVSEDGFLVVMLSKNKTLTSCRTSSAQPLPPPAPPPISNPTAPEAPLATAPKSSASFSDVAAAEYGQAASNVVTGTNTEQTIQHIMDIGGGLWDKDTVTHALRAAYNNPERAVDYLYSGIPETAETAVPVTHHPGNQETGGDDIISDTVIAGTLPASGAPKSSPLNLFPQEMLPSATGGGLGYLDFLRNNQQFQALRSMVQTNPQILQGSKTLLLRLIQEHHAEFLQSINEPVDPSEGDLFDQPDQDMAHAISVTPAEQEAIDRLEAMGFDRTLVIAFLACDRNEELTINYLLENAGDYED